MRKKVLMVIVVILLAALKVGSFVVLHRGEGLNRLLSFMTLSDKYVGEYYNEYIQWENRMIEENPDYDDLKILVDISEKTLYLLNGNELIKKYPIASGKPGSPSPLGSWKVVSKAKWGGGFGTRWVGLNVPWFTCREEHSWGNPLPLREMEVSKEL